ncbi:hypothetical protein EVAR_45091_1 [Eumeta japonica]|uniref:Uncharacterized protein n=1 Tax=Eumeta variegata TaxID=151549 RepID=A0A4C1YHJ3_EUMVA|nr:hypothetical protein EVAR_45091_1 [Eumeta japonica]
MDEIMKAVKRMKVNKAAEYDTVWSETLRGDGDMVISLLYRLLNKCRKSHLVSNDWRKAVVVPLYKGKDARKEYSAMRTGNKIRIEIKRGIQMETRIDVGYESGWDTNSGTYIRTYIALVYERTPPIVIWAKGRAERTNRAAPLTRKGGGVSHPLFSREYKCRILCCASSFSHLSPSAATSELRVNETALQDFRFPYEYCTCMLAALHFVSLFPYALAKLDL